MNYYLDRKIFFFLISYTPEGSTCELCLKKKETITDYVGTMSRWTEEEDLFWSVCKIEIITKMSTPMMHGKSPHSEHILYIYVYIWL